MPLLPKNFHKHSGIVNDLQGILNVKIQQFLAEALLYDARILSTKTNERKSLTKPEIKDNGDIAFGTQRELII